MNYAMKNTGIFPPMVTQMVAIGEESGSLDSMLDKVANIYEGEVDDAVDGLTALIEPMIMAVLGIVIGGLIVAMYLPIFRNGESYQIMFDEMTHLLVSNGWFFYTAVCHHAVPGGRQFSQCGHPPPADNDGNGNGFVNVGSIWPKSWQTLTKPKRKNRSLHTTCQCHDLPAPSVAIRSPQKKIFPYSAI